MTIPRATVRLQFNQSFTLDDATELVDYYAALGISHIYASPLQTAQPGSTHGYDIVDPRAINPELGGEAALKRLVTRLRAADMGLILDIVPNHMGIAGSANSWWQSVLEWGRESPHAEWFDIDWESDDPLLFGKVLMPILGGSYNEVVQAAEIGLRFDETDGRIFASYATHRLPLAVIDYPSILRAGGAQLLAPVIAAFEQINALSAAQPAQRYQQAKVAFAMLLNISHSEAGMAGICAALMSFTAAQPNGLEQLHALLTRQHYRLTCWRNAAEEINWRRFFEVSELAGLRVERKEVFEASHALAFRLYAQGLIDGVRVDHVDGLADPAGYCRALRERLQQLSSQRPAFLTTQPPYVVVEKILAYDEALRSDWKVDGTTGYEFMDQVSALLHDAKGADAMTALWQDWTANDNDFYEEVSQARRQLLAHNLASEFNALARLLHRIARADSNTADYSLVSLRRVLIELLVGFPVYRTYVDADGAAASDLQRMEQAMTRARKVLMPVDHPLLAAIGNWLGTWVGDSKVNNSDPIIQTLRNKAVRRFQQVTPVLTAKSVEDTAFYRYGRLLSRNEVGSDPGRFSIEVQDFHRHCVERRQQFPHNLLATATHDHKRGEEVRARLAVLSELPNEWADTARRWQRLNRSLGEHHVQAADELMLYQMLVGAWPIQLLPGDAAGIEIFSKRIARWQTKALREAKQRSNWFDPDRDYETACEDFLFSILGEQQFLSELVTWVNRIMPAGLINGLTQTLLRMTTPGVPDLYQGTECWDFSLVDPDNRSAVDYAMRRKVLNTASANISLDNWQIGAPKLFIVQRILALRKRMPEVFAQGDYIPLAMTGAKAAHIVAFLRRHQGCDVLVVAPRLVAALLGESGLPLAHADAWKDTFVMLPSACDGAWTDVFTQRKFGCGTNGIKVSDVLRDLPMALLLRDKTPT